MSIDGDLLHVVTTDTITPRRQALGQALIWGSAAIMGLVFLIIGLASYEVIEPVFATWRAGLYAFVLWSRASARFSSCLRPFSLAPW
jgi:multiple sugar transport system permease protein